MAATSMPTSEILDAKHRRLEQLQLRAGRQGYETPPEVANEIQDLQREIAAAGPTTVVESHTILYDLLMETRADVRRLYWLMPILMVLLCAFLVILEKL